MKEPLRNIHIKLTNDELMTLHGRYRRDLEKDNWHYYEDHSEGALIHFRKEHMVYVKEYWTPE